MIVLYGISNCDTVKNARAWLAEAGVEHRFHDFKKSGVPVERLDAWVAAVGWEKLVNRSGMMWRKLDEADKARVVDAASAKKLMQALPSVIKRPVLEASGMVLVGFHPPTYANLKNNS